MKLSFRKEKRDIIRYSAVGAALVTGGILSLIYYPEMCLIYMFLAVFSIPRVTLKSGEIILYDIVFPVIASVFTVYIDHLINNHGHEFFEGETSLWIYLFEHDSRQFQMEIMFTIAFYFVLRALFVPSKWAAAFCPLPLFLLVLTNFYVYEFRGSEFIPFDIYGTRTALNVIGGYRFDIIRPLAFLIIPFALWIFMLLHLEISRHKGNILKYRLTLVCLAAVTVWGTVALADDLAFRIGIMSWADEGTHYNGYVTNFTVELKSMKAKKPESYDRGSMEKLVSYDQIPSIDDSSNIIIILSESYSDMRIYQKAIGSFDDPSPYFDSLGIEDNAIRGTAYSSIFGGKTPNSEAEVLTGIPSCSLPNGSIPFTMYIKQPTYSIMSYLRECGYYTFAMHPFDSSGWARTTAYPYLGFDDYYFIEDFIYDDNDLIRDFVSDKAAYRNLLEKLDEHKGQKKAVLLVTMQNHGGYEMRYDNFDVKDYVDDDACYIDELNMFLSLEHESDMALEYLLDSLEKSDEKYTVYIFGDHQPNIAVPGTNDPGGIKWEVPYMIWTNYDLPEDVVTEYENRQFKDSSFNYACIDILKTAGVPLSPYFQYIDSIRKVIPAFNENNYYSMSLKKWISWSSAEDEAEKESIERYRCLQYFAYFDN